MSSLIAQKVDKVPCTNSQRPILKAIAMAANEAGLACISYHLGS